MRFIAVLALVATLPILAQEPVEHVYATRGELELKAYVFEPEQRAEARPAVLIFHGGGWHMGEPSWGFNLARRFAALGMVAVPIQYRLSNREHPGVTPLEAMADARAAFRWARDHAEELGIDAGRVAGYGWSAGAHLVACAAIFHELDEGENESCVPDLMILSSPAVATRDDAWMKKILGDRASPSDISPDAHVRPGMPPALLLQGRTDTVTTLAGARHFHDAMLAAGNSSRLIVYDGVGHLWTPAHKSDRGWPDPDPEVSAAAYQAVEAFLGEKGFID